MLISHSKRFVFIHIPKTGGSSIEKALMRYSRWQERVCVGFWPSRKAIGAVNRAMGWTAHGYRQWTGIHKHARASVIRDSMPLGLFQEYFRFTVVRNPFDRLISEFFYSNRGASFVEDDDDQALIGQFRRYVHLAANGRVRPMAFSIEDPHTCQSLANAVLHLETIDSDFRWLQHHLGLHPILSLPALNVSKNRPPLLLDSWYDPSTIDLVVERYARDFDLFSYPRELPEPPI